MSETLVFEEHTKHGIRRPLRKDLGHTLTDKLKETKRQHPAFVSQLARKKQKVYQGVGEMPGKSALEQKTDFGCTEATRLVTRRQR